MSPIDKNNPSNKHDVGDDAEFMDDTTDDLREKAHEVSFSDLETIMLMSHRLSPSSSSSAAAADAIESSCLSCATTTGTTNNSNEEDDSSTSTVFNLNELREQVVQDMVGSYYDTTFQSPLEWNTATSSTTSANPGLSSQSQSQQQLNNLTVPLVYCDFTASHKPLKSIEKYLDESCSMYYGNTHTNTSITGSQSSAYVSESRQIIAEACGGKTTGKASQDIVLFA
jgi:hypothetical protein